MESPQKSKEKKERFWEKPKSDKNKDRKKKAPSKKSKKSKSKVKMIIPSRGKSGKK